jgi:hypothetical protein
MEYFEFTDRHGQHHHLLRNGKPHLISLGSQRLPPAQGTTVGQQMYTIAIHYTQRDAYFFEFLHARDRDAVFTAVTA